MIEDTLIAYGPLGCWTAWLLYEKMKLLTRFNETIRANTEMLKQIKNEICKK